MFAIAPYLVEVKDERRQSQDLWNFSAKNNIRDVLIDYFNRNLNSPQIGAGGLKRTFVLRELYASTPESISGRYHTGIFGFESEIYDTSRKSVVHHRKKDQADMLPFFFSFYFPKNVAPGQRTRGLLLLSRFNTQGIRSMVIPSLINYFNSRFPGFSLSVEKVLPTAVVKTLLSQGSVRKIRLVKKTLPKDFANVLSASDAERFLDLEYVFRPKRKTVFSDVNWICDYIEKKVELKHIFTIPDFVPDNIKVEILHGGKSRVVDLGNQGKVSPNIDISHVALDATGHPAIAAWLEESDSIANDICHSWGMANISWKSRP